MDMEKINTLPRDMFNYMATFLEQSEQIYKLQYFNLFNPLKISDFGIKNINDVRKKFWKYIKKLEKYGSHISPINFKYLPNIENIEILEYDNDFKYIDSDFRYLKNIKSFSLCGFEHLGDEMLKYMPNIEDLELIYIGNVSAEGIKNLKKLELLAIEFTKLDTDINEIIKICEERKITRKPTQQEEQDEYREDDL